ncbi:MAG: tetratricopeptide repeat protein [Cyclobacteriaceae bacterium]|nr:tetratricopeptide repeat protein [Cyclobacteriaceae bacterium]
MEILRKTLRLIIVSLLFNFSVYSQDVRQTIEAFRQSYDFEKQGNFFKSIEALQIVYNEKSYEINLRLGWLYYNRLAYIESVNFYERAIQLMPYAIEPRFGIAFPLAEMGNWDQVIAQYQKILSIDPNNTLANYRVGLILYERKEYPKASQHFEKVVNLYPFDLDGLLMLAWTKFQMKQFREARVLFHKCLMHSPDNASAEEGLILLK